jgi:hypothetical protein
LTQAERSTHLSSFSREAVVIDESGAFVPLSPFGPSGAGHMKNKIAVVAMASLAVLPALALAAVNHPAAWPPGPSIWAFLAYFLGG